MHDLKRAFLKYRLRCLIPISLFISLLGMVLQVLTPSIDGTWGGGIAAIVVGIICFFPDKDGEEAAKLYSALKKRNSSTPEQELATNSEAQSIRTIVSEHKSFLQNKIVWWAASIGAFTAIFGKVIASNIALWVHHA